MPESRAAHPLQSLLDFRWLGRLHPTVRMILFAVLLGIVGAFGAQLFLWLLHWSEVLILTPLSGYRFLTLSRAGQTPTVPHFHLYWGIPLATTVGGFLAGFLVYRFAPEAEGHGTDAVVQAFHQHDGYIRPQVPVIKLLSSAITIGSGGSAGPEGPAAQVVAGVGSILGRLCHLSDKEKRYLVLMGVAAGLSAIFKCPLGTAILAVEILYAEVAFEGEVLLYTLIAAAVAYTLMGAMTGWAPLFTLPGTSFTQPFNLLWYSLLGLLAGVVGAVLPTVFFGIRDGFRRLPIPRYFKPAIGGLVVGLIGCFLPGILGSGYGYMQLALEGAAGFSIGLLLLLLVGKIVTVSFTIGSGGSGGIFAPSLFIGIFLGASVAALLHVLGIHAASPTTFAVVGMAAVLAGAVRVPIASLIMVTEMTGSYHLIVPMMPAVALSYFVQFALSHRRRYPTLCEAPVLSPMDSPVHRRLYYDAVMELLRRHQISLDEDVISSQLLEQLAQGHAISVGGTGERLYRLHLAPGAPIAGAEIRSLGLKDLLIMSIIRNDHTFIPVGGSVLEVGDELLVCATSDALQAFMPQVTAPQAAGVDAGAAPASPGP